jgi:hypothetical protein
MNIHSKVAEFCAPYFADRNSIFTAESLSTAFIDSQLGGNWPQTPDDMKQALYIGVQQIVRPLCRSAGNEDVDDPNLDLDLPEEALLQERYSVPTGRDASGAATCKYVPRHLLSLADVRAICNRDRKLSRHYARRADALESWYHRAQGDTA